MRKMIVVVISCFVMVTACSSSSDAFTKQIQQANDLMNEMKYDEAISVLSDVEANVLPGDTYEAGRMHLVEGLKSEAQYMAEHIVELEERYNLAMSAFEETQDSESLDIELYTEAINLLDQTIESFNDMTQLDMYQDLTNAREKITEEIGKLVVELEKDIEDSLDSHDFASAENHLDKMRHLHQTFPEHVTENTVTKYEEKVEEERDRFVYLPETVYRWNETIIENEDGSIEFEGIKDTDDSIELVVSYKGYYHKLSDKISLSPDLILSNGDTLTGSGQETRLLEKKAVKKYRFSSFNDIELDDIIRVNIELPLEQEDAIQVAFDGIDKDETYEIPGVKSIKDLHRPDWTIETDDIEVTIDRFFVEDYDLEISGVVKPKKDVKINEFSTAYLPFTMERDSRGRGIFHSSSRTELYADTEKEFELNYSFKHPITEFHEYVDLHLYEHDFLVDLKSGEIFDMSDPIFIEDVYKSTNFTSIGFKDSGQEELINQSGDRVANNSMIVTASTSNEYYLGGRFDTFTTIVHAHQNYSGVDYGTTELTIYSIKEDDDKELYATTIEEDHKATDIELDVSGVEKLKIKFSLDRGSEGRQQIILEKPMVE